MNGSLDQWTSLFLVASAQGIFLSVLLWVVKSPDRKNALLGTLILLYSISLIDNVWFWSEYFKDFPHLLGISMVFPFLYGPLIHCYFKEAIKSNSVSTRSDWPHFILPLAVFIYLAPYYFSSSGEKLASLETWFLNPINALILPIVSIGSLIYYTYSVFKQLDVYQRKSESRILNGKNWLFQIFLAYGLYVGLFIVYLILIFSELSNISSDYIIAFGSATFIYFIGYLGFTKSKLLNGIKVEQTKYQSTTLTPSASQHLYERIQQYLKETKVFTDSELRLAGLADQLSVTPHQLSQVINEHSNRNFSEFINAYRIEEAKARIAADTRINLLAIDVGFSNKTSFHLAFKKFVGCSPSQYKEKKIGQFTT